MYSLLPITNFITVPQHFTEDLANIQSRYDLYKIAYLLAKKVPDTKIITVGFAYEFNGLPVLEILNKNKKEYVIINLEDDSSFTLQNYHGTSGASLSGKNLKKLTKEFKKMNILMKLRQN